MLIMEMTDNTLKDIQSLSTKELERQQALAEEADNLYLLDACTWELQRRINTERQFQVQAQGRCPECGGELEYGLSERINNKMYREVTCTECFSLGVNK